MKLMTNGNQSLTPPPAFAEDFTTAFQSLRGTLTDLMASVDADPTRPQDVSRRFGLNKNLTWKISKIVGAYDAYGCVRHVPGRAGMDIFLRAIGNNGGDAKKVEAVRGALDDFNRMVKVHAGSRTTLELMAGSAAPGSPAAERLEQSRKLAFVGNSGIWGVQAQVQFSTFLLAPNAEDPTYADLAQVGGLVGFRRLRRDVQWLMFRRQTWDESGTRPHDPREHSVDPESNGTARVPLLREFCSPSLDALEAVVAGDELHYVLPGGPVGNTAALNCIYATRTDRVGRTHRDESGPLMELGCSLMTPSEMLQFDLLVHDSLTWALDPEPAMFSRLGSRGLIPGSGQDRNDLPFGESVHPLGRGLSPIASARVPRYTQMVQHVFEQVGWDSDRFLGFRFTMPYPPMPATVFLRAELPEAPAGT